VHSVRNCRQLIFARDAVIGVSGVIYREFAAAVPEGQPLIDRAMVLKGP
jgi:hypothetical protein